MNKRLLLGAAVLLLASLLLPFGLPHASAQDPLPAIVTFESSLEAIMMSEAESGAATTTLTWLTVGMTGEYSLTLHTYRLDGWETVFDPTTSPLEPRGARVVPVEHPLNFGPPTFLLSIIDSGSRIVDQRVVTIPWAAEAAATEITSFTTSMTTLDAAALSEGSARVDVSWDVSGRPATSQLVFEQVLPDGATSAELPRPNRWIPSMGEGMLAPVSSGETTITLRLSVVDLVNDQVLAEETITLTVTGGTALAVPSGIPPGAEITSPGQYPQAQSAPVVTVPPASSSYSAITSFQVSPMTVNPGSAIRLAWNVQGTGGVIIEQVVPNTAQPTIVVNAQSPQGETTVFLPDIARYSVTYTLWTAPRDAYRTITVNVHCPATFFFGAGDGCPAAGPSQTQASFQPFEGGYMVWRGDTNEIFVHYADGTAGYYLQETFSGLPEAQVDEMPPLDRMVPVTGFGRVWANAPGVRDKLGWAVEPEAGYSVTIQGVATARVPVPEFLFYFTLPDGSVVGTGHGQWRTVG
ncbi:MAG: hypothetical protein GYB65_01690 [Chloroflexi bacterium]|nr:hypothetical protein [Chloroflexota bacterium]